MNAQLARALLPTALDAPTLTPSTTFSFSPLPIHAAALVHPSTSKNKITSANCAVPVMVTGIPPLPQPPVPPAVTVHALPASALPTTSASLVPPVTTYNPHPPLVYPPVPLVTKPAPVPTSASSPNSATPHAPPASIKPTLTNAELAETFSYPLSHLPPFPPIPTPCAYPFSPMQITQKPNLSHPSIPLRLLAKGIFNLSPSMEAASMHPTQPCPQPFLTPEISSILTP